MSIMKRRQKKPVMIYPPTESDKRLEEIRQKLATARERQREELNNTEVLEHQLMELLTQGFARQKKKPDLGKAPSNWKPAKLVQREKRKSQKIRKKMGLTRKYTKRDEEPPKKEVIDPTIDPANPDNWRM